VTGPIIEPPGINALVQVDVGPTGAEVVESVPSRVEDLEGRDLFIAAPGPPSAVPPAAGTFEVVMVIESGVHARRIRRAVMKHQLLSRRGGGR
jgi:hypothetical protein